MGLDPNIILQGQQYDPMQSIGEAMQLSSLMRQGELQGLQADQARQEMQDTITLRNLYKQHASDPAALLQGVRGAGLYKQADELEKSGLERQKLATEQTKALGEIDKTKAETLLKRLEYTKSAMTGVIADPSDANIAQALGGFVQSGVMTQEQAQAEYQKVAGMPLAARKQYLMFHAAKQDQAISMLTPKLEALDLGGSRQIVDMNGFTNPGAVGQSIKKTVTPDAQLSASTAIRGQNMTDARAREGLAQSASGGVTYQTDASGNLVALPTRLAAGAQPVGRPVMGPGGVPLQGKDAGLNDSQSKALLFGSRMQAADKILSDLAAGGVDRPSQSKIVADNIPYIGGALGAVANAQQTPKQQQADQAQRDFVNAVLRRESGAAISPTEFDSAKKQYFPSYGDSPEVIAQKAQNRRLATQGLLAEVPQGKRGSLAAPAAAPEPAPATGVPRAQQAAGAPVSAMKDKGALLDIDGKSMMVLARNPDGSIRVKDPRTGRTGTVRP